MGGKTWGNIEHELDVPGILMNESCCRYNHNHNEEYDDDDDDIDDDHYDGKD